MKDDKDNRRGRMRKLLTTAALLILTVGPAAMAQTGTSGGAPAGSANSSSYRSGPLPAPVGHRQPRPDEVPSEKNLSNPNDPENREDAALDKKIKSICRGC
jgi:hypothetical protein